MTVFASMQMENMFLTVCRKNAILKCQMISFASSNAPAAKVTIPSIRNHLGSNPHSIFMNLVLSYLHANERETFIR